MEEKIFLRALLCVTVLCAVLTLAHAAYALYAYRHCSIVYFIAKELWIL